MRKFFLIISLIAIIIPLSCRAFFLDDFFKEFFEKSSSTQIINEVNVSANTGGNTASEGEVIEGKGKINVEIKNIINGESIEPIDIEIQEAPTPSGVGAPTISVGVKSRIEVKGDDSEPIIEREIIINDEKITEEDKTQKEWLPNFVKEIKNFFQSIFKFFK